MMPLRPIPTSLKIAALCAAAIADAEAFAADLALPPLAPLSALPPVLVDEDAVLCEIRPGTVYFREPYSQPFGPLPPGLVVEVIDVPFSAATDMFVRIKAPTNGVYYGYVTPRSLACH